MEETGTEEVEVDEIDGIDGDDDDDGESLGCRMCLRSLLISYDVEDEGFLGAGVIGPGPEVGELK